MCIESGVVFLKRSELMDFVHTYRPSAGYVTIRGTCEGKHKSAYGYHWRYATDLDQPTNKPV